MKTMTCKQLGGGCDLAFRANTADEMIMAAEQHFKDMLAAGDQAHAAGAQMMADMRTNPASGMEWYVKTQADFAALPED
jgi:Protein of unknown function (DUF1059)